MSPALVHAARVFFLAAALAGCAASNRVVCGPGMGKPALVATLYFGRAIAGREDVSEAEWDNFLSRTVTPNLPDGYTGADAQGAWLNPKTGITAREATKVLTVVVPDTPEYLAAINRVRAAYRQDFHQQSVGLTVSPTCADF